MAWDTAKSRSDQVVSRFQALKNHGDKFICVFLGDGPETEERAYNQKLEKFEPYTEAHKAAGITPSPRFKMNVWVAKEGNGKDVKPLPNGPEVRIFDFNNTQFKPIFTAFDKYDKRNDPQYWFEIERNGAKDDKKWTITCLPDRPITPEEKKVIATLVLLDLKTTGDDAAPEVGTYDKQRSAANGTNGHAAPPAPPPPAAPPPAAATPPTAGGELIRDADKSALVGRLQVLPKEKVSEFLQKFGVQKMKELRQADVPAAQAFLAQLEGKVPAETNPFE